jgi:opacity protein-like surface antigen
MKSHALFQSLLIAATLALGVSGSALAQTATDPAAPAATSGNSSSGTGPGVGLLGSRYVGLDFGYLRFDQAAGPTSGHEFGASYNQPLTAGLDFTAALSDTASGAFGTHPRTDQALVGLTAYQKINDWFKPFLAGQAGVAFNRDAELDSSSGILTDHNTRDDFDYGLSAGAEFQVLPAMVVTPFVAYQDIHFFTHDWDYGAKVTYRLTRRWSVSATPEIDQHHNLAYLGGVNFHF